jgi:outer membrane protein assembly factor BamD (BamD/ComL family)
VGELVFVRPVSIEKVLLLRLCIIFAFVLAVLTPVFVIFAAKAPDFSPGLTILAAVPSALALAALAMAVASVARNAMLGFAAAGAFWGLDLLIGQYFNPLVTLHGYAGYVAGAEMSELWKLNKAVLLLAAGLLYLWHRRILTRPASPRRWTAVLRSAAVVLLIVAVYVASGAVYKVTYGMSHERELAHRTRIWYQQQFRGYGPIPVAWMFGPAFVQYVQAELRRGVPLAERGERALLTRVDIASMQQIVDQYPDSAWADNALFEITTYTGRRRLQEPWIVTTYHQSGRTPRRIVVTEDVEGAAHHYMALADRYPDSPLAPIALEERAAIGLRLLDFDGARAAYQRLATDHPDAPQSCKAGLQVAALNLRSGDAREALRAADVAAAVAPWDRRAEALILAARAAHQGGNDEAARDRYERTLAAARDAIERATRGEKTPSRIPKGALFPAHNAILSEAESALAGRVRPPAAPPMEARIVGRVVVEGDGGSPTRVAIGAVPSTEGLPSPFREGPAACAAVDANGRFELSAVPLGQYGVLAFALRVTDEDLDWQLSGPLLPIDVGQAEVELPTLTLVRMREAEAAPVTRMDSGSPSFRAGTRGNRRGTTRRGGQGQRPARMSGTRGRGRFGRIAE